MKSSEKAYTLYILKCSDETYYTGIALDVDKRVHEHNTSEKGAKYTRARRPVILIYTETCCDRSSALKRELAIKRMTRTEKEGLWCDPLRY
jgi:putative endonuclease